ncbi:MAG: LamG domain-containing protein, partial [bacterium]|nr:LamG domain-containing protein [bacterium]
LDFGIAPFLVEAWVRHKGQREQQYGATVFSYGLGGGFRLGINHKGAVLFTLYGIGEAAGTRSIVPPDGEWHHVAVNFHDCHAVDMYVDGKLTERLDLRGAPRRPSSPLIRIGNEIGLVTAFDGDIDRVRVSRGLYGAEELDAVAQQRETAKP